MIFRQGDVLIKSCHKVSGRRVQSGERIAYNGMLSAVNAGGRLILAEGEATGHSHAISELDGSLFIAEGKLFLKTEEGCTLVHEEHAAIDIPKGNYEITIQREYFPDAIRNVLD